MHTNLHELSRGVLGRRTEHSYFLEDYSRRAGELEDALRERRVLVIGGAGSIGAETVRQLAAYHPRTPHVVDRCTAASKRAPGTTSSSTSRP